MLGQRCSSLWSMLQANSTLSELDLTGNKFTKDGFSTFSKSLKECSLKRLVLASMAPGDDGLAALAEGLGANTALEELDLEEVEVSDASRAALTKLLEANKKVAITGVAPPIERPTAGPEPERRRRRLSARRPRGGRGWRGWRGGC